MIIESRRSRARRGRKHLPRPVVFLASLVILALLVFNLSLRLFDSALRPIVEGVGVERARAIANSSVMRAVDAELSQSGVSYDDLVTVETSDMGEVRALVSDIVRINKLKARVSDRVLENLSLDVVRLSVPLGNLISGELLSGRGPAIDLRLIPYGSVTVNISNEFSEAGINQTLHRILLRITTGISIMMPVSSVSTTIDTTVCVAETVIVGRVPEYYTNITDMPDDLQDSVLNFMNPYD